MAAGIPELLRESEKETQQLLRLLEQDEAELVRCISGELLEACLTGTCRAAQTAQGLLSQIRELDGTM